MRFSALVRFVTNREQKFKKTLPLFLVAASVMCAAACNWEKATSVTVSSGPTFVFSGSGRLASFTVYAPQNGRRLASPNPDVATVIWQIKASEGYFAGSHVQHMQLDYGKPPDGYDQTVPKQPQGAPPLATGAIYSFFAETTDAPAIGGFFYMSGRGPIEINVTDLCLKLIGGQEIDVKCGTNEPYPEPADLERFVQQHQIRR